MPRVIPAEQLSPGDLVAWAGSLHGTVTEVRKEQIDMAPPKWQMLITLAGGRQFEVPLAHPVRVLEYGF